MPGCRFGAEEIPSAFVETVRVSPVAVFLIETSALGSTPPDWSVIVPESVAPTTWACKRRAPHAPTTTTAHRTSLKMLLEFMRNDIGYPPLVSNYPPRFKLATAGRFAPNRSTT